jgi:hypothetical protein
MASDDIVIPDKLVHIVNLMEESKSLKFVVGGAMNLFESGLETPVYGKEHDKFFHMEDSERYKNIFLNCPSPILSQSTVLRTEAIRQIEGWSRDLIADDYYMFMKLLVEFPVIERDFLYLPNICCVKYRHLGSNSYKNIRRQYTMTTQTLEHLAPEEYKAEAVSKKLGYYLSFCLKQGEIVEGIKLLKLSKKRYWLKGAFACISFTISGIKKKCNL